MSKKKVKVENQEGFTFKNKPSHRSNTEIPEPRDIEKELFGKKGVDEVIDSFERDVMGFKPKNAKPINERFYNRIFAVDDDTDRKLLNDLLNDGKRFRIIMWKDTWTVHGQYRVFCIYGENLDARPETNEEKEPEDE